MWSIRQGTSQDFEPVRALHSAVAAEGLWIGAEHPVPWTNGLEEAWRRVADDERLGAWWLAEDGTDLIGFLSLRRIGERAEFGMAVADQWRGRGVGRGLMDAAIASCHRMEVRKLSCEVWPHNGPAIGLYLSRGLLIEGRLVRHHRRRNGQLWDSLVMGLVLDTNSPGSSLTDTIL